LKILSPAFATIRLGTGTTANALAEFNFLILIFILFFIFLFKPHNKRHTDGVHSPLRTSSLFSSYQLTSTAQEWATSITIRCVPSSTTCKVLLPAGNS